MVPIDEQNHGKRSGAEGGGSYKKVRIALKDAGERKRPEAEGRSGSPIERKKMREGMRDR